MRSGTAKRAALLGTAAALVAVTAWLCTVAGNLAFPEAAAQAEGEPGVGGAVGVEATITGMEREALDRWARGDPSGFLEISAPEVVYFDPFVSRRLDGIDALKAHYEGLRGTILLDGYELLNPKVQVSGEVAVLTFNFVSHGAAGTARWNCTEVYRKTPAGWRIVQTHWSLTGPPA